MTDAVDDIDTHDMETVLGLLRPKSPHHELRQWVKEANTNSFGMIDYEEFRTWISNEDVKLLFKMFDLDSNGSIDKSEMEQIFQTLHPSWTADKVQNILEEADLNGDGRIAYEEFLTWVQTKVSEMQISDKENAKQPAPQGGNGGYPNAEQTPPFAEGDDTPTTPLRTRSEKDLESSALKEPLPSKSALASRLTMLDPAVTFEKAELLIENAQRSLRILPAK